MGGYVNRALTRSQWLIVGISPGVSIHGISFAFLAIGTGPVPGQSGMAPFSVGFRGGDSAAVRSRRNLARARFEHGSSPPAGTGAGRDYLPGYVVAANRGRRMPPSASSSDGVRSGRAAGLA
jgi:hypothetical protein